MFKYPNLYEINTRVWIKRFGHNVKLDNVPEEYWKSLADKGMDYIWLMGVWKTNESTIDKYCFEEGLVEEYSRALPDWKHEDVIGSPYAIDDYEVNPALGGNKSLNNLREILHKHNLKLILDFIPNHFSAESSLIKSHPEIFLQADEETYRIDPHTYFKPESTNKIFAHGRDPFFPAWQDTVQINYFSKTARKFLIDKLITISDMCDGVRCDMAMLNLNHVFQNTWGTIISKAGYRKPEKEFWEDAIKATKNHKSDFLFIGEAYWDLEWTLQQLGFDFTYDKKLTDRLKIFNPSAIRSHLHAEFDYQQKLVRFLENHDEERAAKILGYKQSKAAAVIIGTIMGMRLFYDGQFEGKTVKLPVQLGREPEEKLQKGIKYFYNNFLQIINSDIFKNGNWKMLPVFPAGEGDITHENMLAWMWEMNNEKRLVVVNYSSFVSYCRIKIDLTDYPEKIIFNDLINKQQYSRSKDEVREPGLYIKLDGYKFHIFKF